MRFIEILREAFFIIKKEPKLFLPKFFIAFLFGIEMIAFAFLLQSTPALEKFFLHAAGFSEQELIELIRIFPYYLILLVYSFIVVIIDILINAMYPRMVKDFREGKKISFTSALESGLGAMKSLLPIILGISLIFTLLILLISPFFQNLGFFFLVLIAVLLILFYFALNVALYLIYPVSVLEKTGIIQTLKKSVLMAKYNLKNISLGSIFPMLLSFASFILSFYYYYPAFFALFVLLRFLVAMIYTYHMVLDPTIYFIVRSQK